MPKRRNEVMKFCYAGPFAPIVDSRVGRFLPPSKERYTPTSAESWTIADSIGPEMVALLTATFGRESAKPRPRKRARKVPA